MSQKLSQSGIIHIPAILIVVLTIGLLVSANVNVSQNFSDNQQAQGILAAKGENKGNSESRGNSNKNDSDNRGGPPAEVQLRQEVRTSEKEIRTEIREENTKNKIERKGDEFLIKTKIESEDEISEEDEDEATGSADENEDEGELVQDLRAISKFPLRIDISTNQLIMTKNGVERVLTILPAKAVQNMLRAHLKKGLGPKFFRDLDASPSATPEGTPSASATPSAQPSGTPSASPSEEPGATESAQLTILEDQISLEEVDGQVVYKIPAKKRLRLLGFIPVTTDLTGFVSADTGVLIREQESLLARILDLLSP